MASRRIVDLTVPYFSTKLEPIHFPSSPFLPFHVNFPFASSCSTINPILYNVMSHRYRIAFRETLCSRKRGFYSSANGFVREQSSFRETTIAAAGRDHNLNYEGSQLVSY